METDSKYLPELMAEKDSLDPSFTHAMTLLANEIEKLKKGDDGKKDEEDTYLDLFSHKNMKLKERILIPVKLYPKFNFVGKILGPQGHTIKRLQEETGAKISVLGKGSMRDKAKEEELRKGADPKYRHLNMDLHVFIEVFGPPCEAYTRMAHAMEEVKKFLVPDMTCDMLDSGDIMQVCTARFGEHLCSECEFSVKCDPKIEDLGRGVDNRFSNCKRNVRCWMSYEVE
ncbi:KH domain-containing, RNA-binding, signal transduction-associated protein 1-like [Bombina bombina]|uniref:KH domain-containing, RNA-binding, signal transduction-associated protein 1-like n=1 Tax=Bombina bombina TaxID=8345 RepID=UPI00235AC536|nr:KH domain-containing, RNA-binding, signal transduction-associated protein 1-like [Bombina bombina]